MQKNGGQKSHDTVPLNMANLALRQEGGGGGGGDEHSATFLYQF